MILLYLIGRIYGIALNIAKANFRNRLWSPLTSLRHKRRLLKSRGPAPAA